MKILAYESSNGVVKAILKIVSEFFVISVTRHNSCLFN